MANIYNKIKCFCLLLLLLLPLPQLFAETTYLIKSDGIYTFDTSDYPSAKSDDLTNAFTALNILPADFYETVFDANGKMLMDNLFIAVQIDENLAEAMNFPEGANLVAKFDKMDALEGYLMMGGYDAHSQSIKLEEEAVEGKHLYFTGTLDNVRACSYNDVEYIEKDSDDENSDDENSDDSSEKIEIIHLDPNGSKDGFISIKGSVNTKTDIYLHNFKILGVQNSTIPMDGMSDLIAGLFNGMASPICIEPKSRTLSDVDGASNPTPFHADFHIKGDNKLVGGAISRFPFAETEGSGGTASMMKLLGDIYYFVASPISIRPQHYIEYGINDFLSTAGKIYFDDKYPTDATDETQTISTNGLLDLPVEGDDKGTPSIDLGNARGACEFNGGQYIFHCPVSDNMFYVCSMAICYKMVNMLGIPSVYMYGAGTSCSSATNEDESTAVNLDVIFRDGTFSTHSSEGMVASGVDPVAKGWYVKYDDLRVPYNTRIVGGTFLSDVYACGASAESGVAPRNLDSPIAKSLCHDKILIADADIDENGIFTGSLADIDGYASFADYGCNSLKAKQESGQYYIYPYLALDDCNSSSVYKQNWLTVLPRMGLDLPRLMKNDGGQDAANALVTLFAGGADIVKTMAIALGGDVQKHEKNTAGAPMETSYLFYARFNDYTMKYGSLSFMFEDLIGDMSQLITVSNAITLTGSMEKEAYGGVGNIISNVYNKKYPEYFEGNEHYNSSSMYADSWHNANRIIQPVVKGDSIQNGDTYQKNGYYTIEKGMYSLLSFESNRWYTITLPYDVANIYVLETVPEGRTEEESYTDFLARQGEADIRMAEAIVNSVCPDIVSGKGTGVDKNLIDIFHDQLSDLPLTKLNFYNPQLAGHKAKDANYYLYKMKPVQDEDENELVDEVNASTTWDMPSTEHGLTEAINSLSKEWLLVGDGEDDFSPTGWDDMYDSDGNIVNEVLMRRGHIYSIFFPADADIENKDSRFWDGKYIVFEGFGPQRITDLDNSPTFADVCFNPIDMNSEYIDKDHVIMQGNPTFGTDTIADGKKVFRPDLDGNTYTFNIVSGENNEYFYPFQVYAVLDDAVVQMLNSPMGSAPRRDEQLLALDEEAASIPTISGGLSLRVWNNEGIMMQAYEKQTVTVYSADGRSIYSSLLTDGDIVRIPAPSGMYIVQGEKQATKIVIE